MELLIQGLKFPFSSKNKAETELVQCVDTQGQIFFVKLFESVTHCAEKVRGLFLGGVSSTDPLQFTI